MNAQNLILAIGIALFFVSCTKDEPGPELPKSIPNSYFPAYPGSWWEYSLYGSEDYKLEMDTGYYPIEYNSILAPKFKGIGFYYDDARIKSFQGGQAPGTATWRSSRVFDGALSISPNAVVPFSQWHIDYWFCSSPCCWRDTYNPDTSIVTNGISYNDVWVVKETSGDSINVYYDYFAKDIGLVKRDSVDTANTVNLIEILSLENYFIGE